MSNWVPSQRASVATRRTVQRVRTNEEVAPLATTARPGDGGALLSSQTAHGALEQSLAALGRVESSEHGLETLVSSSRGAPSRRFLAGDSASSVALSGVHTRIYASRGEKPVFTPGATFAGRFRLTATTLKRAVSHGSGGDGGQQQQRWWNGHGRRQGVRPCSDGARLYPGCWMSRTIDVSSSFETPSRCGSTFSLHSALPCSGAAVSVAIASTLRRHSRLETRERRRQRSVTLIPHAGKWRLHAAGAAVGRIADADGHREREVRTIRGQKGYDGSHILLLDS